MTQKEILESVLAEIKHVKTHMPNGELKQMAKDFEKVKDDLTDLKIKLLNPENGVIVNTNKNTTFRVEQEDRRKEYERYISEFQELKNWRAGVNRALWIIFGTIAGIVIRMLMMHSDKLG
tara:strand:+ start:314 stop:673 length:360 start_codon:yes stop_codon:yes gene_type:complete